MATLLLPARQVRVQAIGLDVDGVLRDTAQDAYIALCKTVEELGGKAPAFNDFVHEYESDAVPYYRRCGVKGGEEEIYSTYMRHICQHETVLPFEDVTTFLSSVRDLGLQVFTVSSHPTHKLYQWFVTHGISEHMSCIYGGSRDKRACLRNACRDIRVASESVCYVGDWGLDMRAAKVAGLLPIGITRGYPSQAGLLASGAIHVVDHLHELTGLFE